MGINMSQLIQYTFTLSLQQLLTILFCIDMVILTVNVMFVISPHVNHISCFLLIFQYPTKYNRVEIQSFLKNWIDKRMNVLMTSNILGKLRSIQKIFIQIKYLSQNAYNPSMKIICMFSFSLFSLPPRIHSSYCIIECTEHIFLHFLKFPSTLLLTVD